MAVINSTIAGVDKTAWEVLERSSGIQEFAPGDTDFHLLTLITIPGGMMRHNSMLRFDVGWSSKTGAAGNAQAGIWSDGASDWVEPDITITADAAIKHVTLMTMNNSLSSQIVAGADQQEKPNEAVATKDYTTMSLDFTSDQLFQWRYKTLNAADTIQLAYWTVEVLI